MARTTRLRDNLKGLRLFFLVLVGVALALEAQGGTSDPWAVFARLFHDSFSAWHGDLLNWNAGSSRTSLGNTIWAFDWADVKFVASPVEILFLVLLGLLIWRLRARVPRLHISFGTLKWPLIVFLSLVTVSLVYGLARGAQFNIALWEVRGFMMMALVYVITCILLRNDTHANQFIWTVFIASTALAIESIIRWLVYVRNSNAAADLAFDHVDSVIFCFTCLLCVGLLTLGGTRAQRIYALGLLPLMIFTIEIMRRRVAFALLIIGIGIFFILLYRLRPRLTWKVLIPLALISALYLGATWNNNGSLGQPARAIRSAIAPDPRDAQSDSYRTTEKQDIVANIRVAPYTGLGFGEPFTMFIPLPDLSFWPFWHFTTHNAVLWLWMKAGALTFGVFLWLLGRAVFDGSRALETQREHWEIVTALRQRLQNPRRRRRAGRTAAEREAVRAAVRQHVGQAGRGHESTGMEWNVPTWERVDARGSHTVRRSGAVALLAAAICTIPMQISFSYVDLGLTSERDLLLIGILLALISRAHAVFLNREDADGTPLTGESSKHVDSARSAREQLRERLRAAAQDPQPANASSAAQDEASEEDEPPRASYRPSFV